MIQARLLMVSIVLAIAALGGCRAGQWKKKDVEQKQPSAIVLPRMTGAATEGKSSWSATMDVDEKTGRIKSNLVLRLDYFPAVQPGSTNLPSCYTPFPADFDLGVITCEQNPALQQPLTAANVDQDCYTNPKVARLPAQRPLIVAGCRRARLALHSFDPRVKVDLESRDLN